MLSCSASAPGSLFMFTIVLFPACALLISPTSWIFCPRISWSDEVGLFPVCSPRNSGEVRPRKNRSGAETSQTVVHLRENEVAPSQMLLREIFSERLKCLACGDVTFPRKSSRFRFCLSVGRSRLGSTRRRLTSAACPAASVPVSILRC